MTRSELDALLAQHEENILGKVKQSAERAAMITAEQEAYRRKIQARDNSPVELGCINIRGIFGKIIPAGEGKWKILRFTDGRATVTRFEFENFIKPSQQFMGGIVYEASDKIKPRRTAPMVDRGPTLPGQEAPEPGEANTRAQDSGASKEGKVLNPGDLVED